jgi:hypothetical protein
MVVVVVEVYYSCTSYSADVVVVELVVVSGTAPDALTP